MDNLRVKTDVKVDAKLMKVTNKKYLYIHSVTNAYCQVKETLQLLLETWKSRKE